MSSILKALQKLERDKVSRKTREPDITLAVKAGSNRVKPGQSWMIPLAMGVAAIASVLVTYAVMGGFSPKEKQPQKSEQPPLAQTVPHQSEFTGVTETAPPFPAPVKTLPLLQPVPQRRDTPQSNPQPANKTLSPKGAADPVQVPVPDQLPSLPESSSTHQELIHQKNQQNELHPKGEEKPHHAAITVSGIAWQKDSSSRLAVINGNATSEGGTVEGARVEQISPDRVKFSRDGKTFEVMIERDIR